MQPKYPLPDLPDVKRRSRRGQSRLRKSAVEREDSSSGPFRDFFGPDFDQFGGPARQNSSLGVTVSSDGYILLITTLCATDIRCSAPTNGDLKVALWRRRQTDIAVKVEEKSLPL